MENITIEKDESFEIISKDEKFWRDVNRASKDNINQLKEEIKAQKRMIEASDLMMKKYAR